MTMGTRLKMGKFKVQVSRRQRFLYKFSGSISAKKDVHSASL